MEESSSSSSSESEDGDFKKEHKPKVNFKSKKLLEVLCEPDEIKTVMNFSQSYEHENALFYFHFDVVKPESNGADIFAFNIYQENIKIPYSSEKIKIQIKKPTLAIRITA